MIKGTSERISGTLSSRQLQCSGRQLPRLYHVESCFAWWCFYGLAELTLLTGSPKLAIGIWIRYIGHSWREIIKNLTRNLRRTCRELISYGAGWSVLELGDRQFPRLLYPRLSSHNRLKTWKNWRTVQSVCGNQIWTAWFGILLPPSSHPIFWYVLKEFKLTLM